ncbi:efflux transporter outer membrane subunit [Shewanella avicenniae]|uniref:efflux transporter outer membrane subunit n=1 Tax=Shewanella avicenniae TaxID=2814294 RepID=UPI002B48BD52|nr:efflux transporter outer membrane subunit [Shewanella avicenniae]
MTHHVRPKWQPLALVSLAVFGVLGLNGCALHDADAQVSALQQSSAPAFAKAFAEQNEISWPTSAWWQRYQDAQLNALVEHALAQAPTIKMAAARVQQAQAMTQQVGAAELPQLGMAASASETKVSYRYQAYNPPKNWNDYGSLTLNFSYDIDFWNKNKSAVAAASSEYAAALAEQASAQLMLTTAIANAYAELARLYANLDTVTAALQVRQKTAELLTQRFDNGLENRGTVSQAQAVAKSANAEVLAVQESIMLQKHALAALLGAGPDQALTIDRPAIQLSQSFGLPANAGLGLLAHRPDVTAARWRAQAAAYQIGVAKAQFYPDVSLSAFVGIQAFGLNSLFDSGNDAGSVGPAIYLPLFSGGRLQGQLSAAEAGFDLAAASYQQTLANALQEVADVLTSTQALDGQISETQAAVDAAEEAHQIASNRYRGGLATYLEVLTAEDRLLGSKRALVNLQSRAFSLDLALVHALGGGYQSHQS